MSDKKSLQLPEVLKWLGASGILTSIFLGLIYFFAATYKDFVNLRASTITHGKKLTDHESRIKTMERQQIEIYYATVKMKGIKVPEKFIESYSKPDRPADKPQ